MSPASGVTRCGARRRTRAEPGSCARGHPLQDLLRVCCEARWNAFRLESGPACTRARSRRGLARAGRAVRAADGAGLENQWAAMPRGFESHALRIFRPHERTPVNEELRHSSRRAAMTPSVARHGRLKRHNAWKTVAKVAASVVA